MTHVRRCLSALLAFVVLAGLIQPPALAATPLPATAADEPTSPRPMPPDPYQEWDGSAGVPDWGDPRFRQLVVDNAELAEDPEVREAAAAALAAGTNAALMEFLNQGLREAKARATARKQEQARQDRAAIEPLRGTGGPYFNAEVERVLSGSDSDRMLFLAYGKEIAQQRDADATRGEQERLAQLRSRVQMLVGAGGPEVKRAAQAALDGGDAAIAEFLARGYLVAAKADADAREQYLKDQEARDAAAEQLSDLAKRAARAAQARKDLLVAHGNGVRALEQAANALVSASNEARRAAQILAANKAGGQHPADAFTGVKEEVARQLGYARQAATDAQQASATAQVQANVLVETGLTYGTQWADMARGMASAAQAAVTASETAQHAIDATAFTDQARNAQEEAERHAEEAHQWRLHAEEHARAAAQLADAARVQADAAKDAAVRTKAARQAAEAAEAQAWAAAERTRTARLTAEREAATAAAARATAERERSAAAAARARADQQASVARSARAEADRQAGIASVARQGADDANGRAAQAETNARNEERNAAQARDRAYAAEREQRAADARSAAMDAMAAASRGGTYEKPAQDAANEARGYATAARAAAGAARGAANTATGAAAGARAAATEAGAHAARARAAAQQAAAAAARANAAANQAEAEARAAHAARLRADSAASDATFEEARAAEAARNAVSLAEQAASEAVQAVRSAERTRAEADAAAAESVSAATQAGLAVQASVAARASSQAITDPANTAITVVAPFSGSDLGADFVLLVANQAKAVGAEQAAAAARAADEATEAARLAQEAADRAAGEVKPAYDAAAAASRSSAAAARSAAEAQQAAADAAVDGAAARAAASRAAQADAQAHDDAVKARAAANAASNDAAIAGRAASAAERDAAAARAAASAAESDAAAARDAAGRAESDATAAETAATEAQTHADATAEAARNAMQAAIDAGHAADRAEQAERDRQAAERAAQAAQAGDDVPDMTAEEEQLLYQMGGPDLVEQNREALEQAKKGIIDYLIENGGQVLLDIIGVTDAKKCFSEGDVAACLWTVVNVGSLLLLLAKLPAVASAITKVVAGLTKFLEASAAGREILELGRRIMGEAKVVCGVGNSFTGDTPVLLADGTHRAIAEVEAGDEVLATDPETGRTERHQVLQQIVGEGQKTLVDVTVDLDGPDGDREGTVTATDGHPFWVDGQGRWLPAIMLAPGDHLRASDGHPVEVLGTQVHGEPRRVYNLSVEGIHTYYVTAGTADVLVHNTAPCPRFSVDSNGEIVDFMSPSGKLSLPSNLEGGTAQEIGAKIWGHGTKMAQELVGTRTPEQLRALCSKRDAERLMDFYENAHINIPSNPTAPIRVQLAKEIIDAWS
ncbi:polymorphic toxin-type HINT domain-containing protein [Amycolatopsis sacchari]|uniref:polymorphic toxin-type HINT domain-containing protein n=1 Tax=Amycolatopsis sacchari TaxID=115433 RepID=UPI003EBB38E6